MSKLLHANQKAAALSCAELNMFCEQIALVLKAGISVYEGICILQEEAGSAAERALYQGVATAMDDYAPLPDALAQSGAFPQYMVQMVAIGEVSGRLDTVLEQLAQYYKREQAMQDSVRYAVRYPLLMLLMMGAVIAVLVAKVLPIFNEVFVDLGSELTGFSKNVMDIGMSLSNSLTVIMAVVAVVLVAVFIAQRTKAGKAALLALQSRNFITKKLVYQMAISRFASGMSLMLASGLDTEESLGMVEPLVSHAEVREKITEMRENIAAGQTFAEAMASQELFSQTYHRMLGIGERTGNLDEVMQNIATRYETEIENSLSKLIAVIEPSLVAILSVVVGVILLSVMLPLMSIMSVR